MLSFCRFNQPDKKTENWSESELQTQTKVQTNCHWHNPNRPPFSAVDQGDSIRQANHQKASYDGFSGSSSHTLLAFFTLFRRFSFVFRYQIDRSCNGISHFVTLRSCLFRLRGRALSRFGSQSRSLCFALWGQGGLSLFSTRKIHIKTKTKTELWT